MLRNESHRFGSIDWQKMMEEVLRISDRNAVVRDRKWIAEYSSRVDDQILIHTMAGEL
jgi:ABC-type sugar transport system ATPase subunit